MKLQDAIGRMVTHVNLLVTPDEGKEMDPSELVRVSRWRAKQVYFCEGELYVAVEESAPVEFINITQENILSIIQGEGA